MIVSLQGMLHARRGDGKLALECVRRALDSPRSKGHAHHTYYQSPAYTPYSGDTAKAMAWLQRRGDTGFPCWSFFRMDPHLENLRGEPAFTRLVADLEGDVHRHQDSAGVESTLHSIDASALPLN